MVGGQPSDSTAIVGTVPWPDADWTFAPLGYRPGTTPHTLVPIYSPGLPLIMAGFMLVFGSCGPYYVTPLSGAALVLLTFLLGRRVAGVATGTIAALLIATSPTMLFWLMMPMTDVIVATLWSASLLLAFRPSTWSIISSGAIGGLAILVRPNLLPLITIPLLIVLWNWKSGSLGRALTRGFYFGAAVAPSLIIVAAVNRYLYGSTTESGYGTVRSIYSVANLGANLKRYPAWLLESQGILVFIFLIALFKIRGTDKDEVPRRGAFLLFIALTLLAYLFYTPFDAWWFLRFVLPAFPLIFVLTADGLLWMTRRLSSPWRTIALLTGCAWMVFHGLRFSQEHDVSGLGMGEQRYADVGHFIAQQLPPKSACLAMQHSGSIRHYSHCMTLRYDILSPEWLDRAIAHLVQQGYHPYIVLENWRRRRSGIGSKSTRRSVHWTGRRWRSLRAAGRFASTIRRITGAGQNADCRGKSLRFRACRALGPLTPTDAVELDRDGRDSPSSNSQSIDAGPLAVRRTPGGELRFFAMKPRCQTGRRAGEGASYLAI